MNNPFIGGYKIVNCKWACPIDLSKCNGKCEECTEEYIEDKLIHYNSEMIISSLK